jgi:hypothetical protein
MRARMNQCVRTEHTYTNTHTHSHMEVRLIKGILGHLTPILYLWKYLTSVPEIHRSDAQARVAPSVYEGSLSLSLARSLQQRDLLLSLEGLPFS